LLANLLVVVHSHSPAVGAGVRHPGKRPDGGNTPRARGRPGANMMIGRSRGPPLSRLRRSGSPARMGHCLPDLPISGHPSPRLSVT
jgi:hypothetical protein